MVWSTTCAISSAGERFPDTEEVTGSIPVSRTTYRSRLRKILSHFCCTMSLADVAQLVAHNLAKVRVAGSSPVIRSMHQGVKGQITALLCYRAS